MLLILKALASIYLYCVIFCHLESNKKNGKEKKENNGEKIPFILDQAKVTKVDLVIQMTDYL